VLISSGSRIWHPGWAPRQHSGQPKRLATKQTARQAAPLQRGNISYGGLTTDRRTLRLGSIGATDVGTKSRSLKRFLGLRRQNKDNHRGGIEHILPSRISGWAVSANSSFHEVRLLVGQKLVARTEVNQPRPDVCEKLAYQGEPGFTLQLPEQLPTLDWKEPVRLLALSVDGGIQSVLQLLSNPEQTEGRLRSLMQSDLLGLEGHFDGLISGALQGWAARSRQHQPAEIWLQSEGNEPISVHCDLLRGGMASLEMPNYCGFRFMVRELPCTWAGNPVWCSFDREDKYRLPQNQDVIVPIPPNAIPSEPKIISNITSYKPQILMAPEDLRKHWQALEDFRHFLDDLENELDRREALPPIQKQPARLHGWIKRLLGRS